VHFSTFHCNFILDANSLKSSLFCIDLQAYMYIALLKNRSRANFLFCCEEICAGGWYKFNKNRKFGRLDARRMLCVWTRIWNHHKVVTWPKVIWSIESWLLHSFHHFYHIQLKIFFGDQNAMSCLSILLPVVLYIVEYNFVVRK